MNLLKYEIVLTYSRSTSEKNRICGHTFEVLDYYLYFKDLGVSAIIVIQDDISLDKIKEAWNNNYNLNHLEEEPEVVKVHDSIIARKVLNCSGFFKEERTQYVAKQLFQFRCGVYQKDYLDLKNVIILQDNRIFEDIPKGSINYVKKINTRYLKRYPNKEPETFMYWNTVLRLPTEARQDYLVKKYHPSIITNQETKYKRIQPPINILKTFAGGTYVYTEVTRKFDCSSRLLLECYLNNIEVIFDFDIPEEEYFQKDKGLYYRWYDIKHNIHELFLENDNLKELLWKKGKGKKGRN